MMAFFLISLFEVQHLTKFIPVSVSPLYGITVGTHYYQLLSINSPAPLCPVLSVQLNSVTSIITLACLIRYQMNCQWSGWVSWWSQHLSYISKVLTAFPAMRLYHKFMPNRTIKLRLINWVRCGVLGLILPIAPLNPLHASVSVLRLY